MLPKEQDIVIVSASFSRANYFISNFSSSVSADVEIRTWNRFQNFFLENGQMYLVGTCLRSSSIDDNYANSLR
jgi:hypothetical protein